MTKSIVDNAVVALKQMMLQMYAKEQGFEIKVLKKTKSSLIVEYKFKKEGVAK